MRQERFDNLVKRLDAVAARSPLLFRIRTALWLAVGYLGIVLSFTLVVGFAGAMLAVALATKESGIFFIWLGVGVLVFGLFLVGRVMWGIIRPPMMVQVTESQVPRLFAALRELAAQSAVPMFDRVHVSEDMNASVCEVPRLGLPFWQRRHLMLGLPVMHAVTEDEFRAVLAHEFGHLSPQQRRFSNMVYRLRRTWERIFAKMEHMTAGTFPRLLLHFVRWFWPRFNAHAFVLSRTCEHECDAAAARHVGDMAISRALMRFRVLNHMLNEQFWEPLWRESATLEAPPAGSLSRMVEVMKSSLDSAPALQAFEEAKRIHTTNADTHPCLRDRLTRLGTWERLKDLPQPLPMPATGESAAEKLLGDALPELWQAVGKNWADEMAPNWRKRHARARLLRPIIAAGDTGRREEEWKRVSAVAELEGDDAAEPLLTDLLLRHADHGTARFELGRLLLKRNDEAGLDHLRRAVKADRSLHQPAAEVLHDYYWRLGDAEESKKVLIALERQENTSATSTSSSILPHALPSEDLAALLERLRQERRLAAAWLGMVPPADGHSLPMLYLCLAPRRPWWRFWITSDEEGMIRRISSQLKLPGRTLVFSPVGRHRKLAGQMMIVPETRLEL